MLGDGSTTHIAKKVTQSTCSGAVGNEPRARMDRAPLDGDPRPLVNAGLFGYATVAMAQERTSQTEIDVTNVWPQSPILIEKLRAMRENAGLSEADLVDGLEEQREQLYRERYGSRS